MEWSEVSRRGAGARRFFSHDDTTDTKNTWKSLHSERFHRDSRAVVVNRFTALPLRPSVRSVVSQRFLVV